MREMVKAVIDMYGTGKIRYGIIVFGATTSPSLSFSETYPTKKAFKDFINLMRRVDGEPDLQRAFEEAKRLFDSAPPRPNAKKVLVVIVDNKSSNRPEEIKAAAKPLHDNKIKVRFYPNFCNATVRRKRPIQPRLHERFFASTCAGICRLSIHAATFSLYSRRGYRFCSQ